MTARPGGLPGEFLRLRTSGWIVSLCLHAGALFLAGLFAAKIGLAPSTYPFHWDVTVVGPDDPSPIRPALPNTSIGPSKIARPAQRSVPASSTHSPRLQAPPADASPITTPHQIADSVFTSHTQEAKPDLEHLRTVPVPPSPESTCEQILQHQRTSSPVETPAESHPPLPTPVSSLAEALPASETPPPSLAPQETPQSAMVPAQTASLTPSTTAPPVAGKPDYGWLADSLLRRIEALKQYPAAARLDRLEGRVVVRIVIEEDGHITSLAVAKSSGHDVLDQAALTTLQQASPLALSKPLEKSPMTIQIPISYRLDR